MNNYMYILEGETEQKIIEFSIKYKCKSDINKCTNLYTKLVEKGFNIEKLWIKEGFPGILCCYFI